MTSESPRPLMNPHYLWQAYLLIKSVVLCFVYAVLCLKRLLAMTNATDVWNVGDTAKFYVQVRPRYTPDHVTRLLEFYHLHDDASSKSRPKLVLDVACGSGQFTNLLADHCDQVIGLDSSSGQISEAKGPPNVSFKVASAYDFGSEIQNESVDIITVAQAVHYFDHHRFFAEVKRCLRPGGVLYLFGHENMNFPDEFGVETTNEYRKLMSETFLQYWPQGVQTLWTHYKEMNLPFEEKQRFDGILSMEYTGESFLHFVQSMSAYAAYQTAHPDDHGEVLKPLSIAIRSALKKLGKEKFIFSWHDFALLNRKPK